MITTAVFRKNPTVSSSLRGGGKSFTIVKVDDFRILWQVPDTSTYENGEIVIVGGPKLNEYYRYSSEGNTLLNNLPTGLKQRIVDDFNTLSTTEQEIEEVEMNKTTVVREEEVFGSTIKMILNENSLDIRAGEDGLYYTVSTTYQGGFTTAPLQTQIEAEEAFSYQVDRASRLEDSGSTITYRDIQIDFDNFIQNDGSSGLTPEVNLRGYDFGNKKSSFVLGDEVAFDDAFNSPISLGIITMNESEDVEILKQYIDLCLDGREDPQGPLGNLTDLPVYSWGWYKENPDSPLNPFSTYKLNEVYTVANTDGRIMGLNDDDNIMGGYDSGAAKLVVKEGYRVRLRVMTQERDYFVNQIPNLEQESISHTQYNLADAQVLGQRTNYEDTDKLTIDLFGNDSIEIDIDDNTDWAERFNIRRNGSTIVKGAPNKINDETFMAIIEVEKLGESQGQDGGDNQGNYQGGNDGESESEGGSNGLAIVIGGILILVVLYMVFSKGDDE